MVKTSAFRSITTPRNFIFEPLGTERRLTFGALVVVRSSCAEAIAALIVMARQMTIKVNICRIELLLIFCSFDIYFGMQRRIPGFRCALTWWMARERNETKDCFLS